MENRFSKYVNFSLFNLVIVALFGVVMRYKIGFEFPFFDQKSLQHAHSHFAFSGWISQTIILLIIHILFRKLSPSHITKYFKILNLNLVCAYGMLIAFTVQGYGPVSIFFSSSSIIISFKFGYYFFKDVKTLKDFYPGLKWFKAAIIFNLLSSVGTFTLAYTLISKDIHQDVYLAAVYHYLHFQYNGWFFFACMGLLAHQLHNKLPGYSEDKQVFPMFIFSCIPAYFLSTLWLKLPMWIYVITVIAAIVQVYAWIRFLVQFRKYYPSIKNELSTFTKYLFIFVGFALSIKLTLQLFSTIPYLSKLAFGFRTIVIAYLHLVLLAIISTFLLSYLHTFNFIKSGKLIKSSLLLFTGGIFMNELILLIQGIASFSYTLIPLANEMLFGVAVLLFAGSLLLLIANLSEGDRNKSTET